MKFNCDMGESFGHWSLGWDEALMPLIDQANIACGGHASDPDTMAATVRLAGQHGVQIGAHPGYPDKAGFGRRDFPLTGESLRNELLCQIGALAAISQCQLQALTHIKPHGALYNKMMRDEPTLIAIMQAVTAFDASIPLMVQAGDQTDNDHLRKLADDYGATLLFEAFADRQYATAQQLADRKLPGAVHSDAEQIIRQVETLAAAQPLISLHGRPLHIEADTLCFHGDNPASVQALQQLRGEA